MKLNKKQKGIIGGIILWMILRVVYLPLIGNSSLFGITELIKTAGVIFFGVILVCLLKDKSIQK